jgi:hypothetical protein
MCNGKRQSVSPFPDQCVIYYAPEDKCWVAHSVRTDQIGTGDCIVDALASLLRAVDFVVEDAVQDHTLAVLREAPKEIQDMLNTAKLLPKEAFEIAHKMARGKWPQDFPANFTPKQDHLYKAAIKRSLVTA